MRKFDMGQTRRATLLTLLAATSAAQDVSEPHRAKPGDPEADVKLPNGKSQKDAISKQAHEDAIKEVESLITVAEELRDDLKRSGQFVVAVSSLKKTDEIEKLARRIRSKLKA